jgi:hypothetical protein
MNCPICQIPATKIIRLYDVKTNCSICLNTEDNENYAALHCGHVFHDICITHALPLIVRYNLDASENIIIPRVNIRNGIRYPLRLFERICVCCQNNLYQVGLSILIFFGYMIYVILISTKITTTQI